jgi:hypothetical protein
MYYYGEKKLYERKKYDGKHLIQYIRSAYENNIRIIHTENILDNLIIDKKLKNDIYHGMYYKKFIKQKNKDGTFITDNLVIGNMNEGIPTGQWNFIDYFIFNIDENKWEYQTKVTGNFDNNGLKTGPWNFHLNGIIVHNNLILTRVDGYMENDYPINKWICYYTTPTNELIQIEEDGKRIYYFLFYIKYDVLYFINQSIPI